MWAVRERELTVCELKCYATKNIKFIVLCPYSIHMLWVVIRYWLLLCKPGTMHVWSFPAHCTSFLMKLLLLLFKKHWYVYNTIFPLFLSHVRACVFKVWQVPWMRTQILLWVTRRADARMHMCWIFMSFHFCLWFFDCVKLITLNEIEYCSWKTCRLIRVIEIL